MGRKETLKSMRDILILRRDGLRQALAGDVSLLREMEAQQGGDVVDFATDSASGEISSQLAEVQTRELKNVVNAIERMEKGTYGKCEACKGSIPLARLQALPYAAYCIDCKRLAEDAGVEPGSVVDWSVILDAHSDDMPNSFNIS